MISIRSFSDRESAFDLAGLMQEYASTLDSARAREAIVQQIADLPQPFVPPEGALFVGYLNRLPAGMVAIKSTADPASCEMKRLSVSPQARGLGLGRELVLTAIASAGDLGYRSMKLATFPDMSAARLPVS
ncbi:GNAT family N-acetyltransferase [Microvirga lotononidis]|uniref:Acetyltransferase, N-acetylglutamate synthase n=1 Tax=Microvirga lotononidis TaxID=864069 RepID=I4Z1V1_9HYPH|nr:GNAT family N-acetyltransferase [Microvirga lotononidis]EIM30193.1 acetyltransferase, N-acetylglutamate synthase [Microvirga lotononidis]WQO31582.1 GNAT family N-acetyltransferase [Microvirga lotononidis]